MWRHEKLTIHKEILGSSVILKPRPFIKRFKIFEVGSGSNQGQITMTHNQFNNYLK